MCPCRVLRSSKYNIQGVQNNSLLIVNSKEKVSHHRVGIANERAGE